jgi:hypothetical protein
MMLFPFPLTVPMIVVRVFSIIPVIITSVMIVVFVGIAAHRANKKPNSYYETNDRFHNSDSLTETFHFARPPSMG